MSQFETKLIVDCHNRLGECVQWNPQDHRVYWTDVYSNKLYSCLAEGDDLIARDLPDMLGSFAFDPDGNLIAAFSDGLFRYHMTTGQLDRLSYFEVDLEPTRLNDGRCDRAGRFVVGGCHQGIFNQVSSVISYDGGSEPKTIIEKVSLTNGIAFSKDGSRMYFSDSQTQVYHWYEYDNATGQLGERHVLTEIPAAEGFADGSCVDADDNLWNAQYYGGIVQQYHPDGSKGIRIEVGTKCPTCVCFGGENLDTLYITTAAMNLTNEEKAQQPTAGGLFMVKPGVKGLPENRFATRLFV